MIERVNTLPLMRNPSAQGLKIRNVFSSYPEAEIFSQNNGQAFISLLDLDVVIENLSADIQELKSFLNFINPKSIFSDIETLRNLDLDNIEKVNVLITHNTQEVAYPSDTFKSDEVYEILKKGGFSLPDYEFFAVDFCRRLNKGTLKCFAMKNRCLAVTLNADDYCMLNGIVSFEKGFGTVALKSAIAQNNGKQMMVCCKDDLLEFYYKNGFFKIYEAGYWIRERNNQTDEFF